MRAHKNVYREAGHKRVVQLCFLLIQTYKVIIIKLNKVIVESEENFLKYKTIHFKNQKIFLKCKIG